MSSKLLKPGGFRNKVGRFGDRIVESFRSSSPLPSQNSLANRPPANPTSNDETSSGQTNVAWAGLETGLRALRETSDVFPPLKAAVGELLACLDGFQVSPITRV
jgi:hypothetical protein